MRRLLAFATLAFIAAAFACSGTDALAPTPPNESSVAPPLMPPPSFATADNGLGVSITTDKDDYQPGDTVWFTGAGWAPGDTLDILLEDDPTTHPPHTWAIGVGPDGTFRDSTYVVDIGDLGVTFTLTATSRRSGQILKVNFTDGTIQNNMALNPASVTVTAGNSATYTLTVSFVGNNTPCTANLSAAGLPSGAVATFNPTSVTGAANNTPKTSALTITTTAATATGSHGFTVLAAIASSGCGGADRTTTGTLVISAPANAAPQVDGGGPYSGAEGSAITLGPTVSDPDGDALTYKWTVNTTGIDAGGTCTFDDDTKKDAKVTCTDDSHGATGGKFTLTLEVNDGQGHTVSDVADLTVTNANPTASAGGPYSGSEGTPVQLAGSGDDPGDNDDHPRLTYAWTVNTAGIDAGGQCTFDDATKRDAKVTCTDDSNGGTFELTLVVSDDDGATSTAAVATLGLANAIPTANAGGPYSGDEGSAIQLGGSGDDPGNNDDAQLTYLWTVSTTGIDAGGSCAFDDVTKPDAKVTCTDDSGGGAFQLQLVVSDDDGATSAAATVNLTVTNAPPAVATLVLDPPSDGHVYPLSGQPAVEATFTDAGANDAHSCRFEVKDEVLGTMTTQTAAASGGQCVGGLNAPAAGLYTVRVTVTDDDLAWNAASFPSGGLLIVIYDPSAGFVTGGGWIDSPPGACRFAACTGTTGGKATFGFVSKYIAQKDKAAPVLTGNTEFNFHAGNLSFKSSSYEWLVVNGNSGRAQYKGEGAINGVSNYGFVLTAYDGSPDSFRIKIWNLGTGLVVYDNQINEPDNSTLATSLGGGSIIIHVPKR
ncbi:MAG TPA: hypothetical protein VJ596_08265 [Gemmatimonadaceae bacterium]|nr:hypothetical protein [Gemmatimonadaceae bacterium]